MTQTNLYIEDDNLRLYVDVQPLFIDELENSKNSAAASAAQAAQSEEAARTWKNDIEDYKTGLELFFAQALDGIANSYDDSISGLNNAKNSAISNISSGVQGYINQAREYAEQAQTIVDNRVSKDHLNQSKGLLTGSVSADEDVCADVKKYAHSTFDASKFTVVGSPIVTSDGIASGLGVNSSAIEVLTSNFNGYSSISDVHSFELEFDFYPDITYSGWLCSNSGLITIWQTIQTELVYTVNYKAYDIDNSEAVDLTWSNTYKPDGSQLSNSNLPATKQAGLIKFRVEWDGTTHKKTIIQPDTNRTFYSIATSSLPPNLVTGSIYAKFFGAAQSINLKNISVKINGVPVFSGNKTGVDTVKADFTKVGSPTITDDLVTSGFSSSNYLTVACDFPSNVTNLEFYFPAFTLNSGYSSETFILQNSVNGKNIALGINGSLKSNLYMWGDSQNIVVPKTGSLTYSVGVKYYTRLLYNGTTYTFQHSTNNNDWETDSTYTSSISLASATTYIIGNNVIYGSAFNGSVDLTTMRVLVNNKVICRPCILIPYTESKTGSKVVNAIYRDRVNDMAEQFGYAPYYTLDETNGNFTLPMGDIYGMIENLRQLIIQRTS